MTPGDKPSVTVSEIIQLALPAGSKVLAGDAGLGRPITWARLLRARPGVAVEAGELVLLPAEALASTGGLRVTARAVEELIEAGIGAFVVLEAPDQRTRELCSSASRPLILVPGGSALVELERAVISLIVDREAQLRRRAEEVYGRLLAVVLSNAGLAAVVKALAAETTLRVAVFDDNGTLLTLAPADERFSDALTGATRDLLSREIGGSGAGPARPIFLQLEQDGAWSGHLQPLQIGAAPAGFLGLLGQAAFTNDLNRLVAERAAALVALELAKQRAVVKATQRWHGDFLDDLLEWSFPSEEAATARAQQLGYDLLRAHAVFALAVDPSSDSSHGEEQLRAARQKRRFPEVASAEILRLEPGTLLVERDGAVLGLLPLVGPEDPAESVERVERLRAAIADLLPGISISAGLGQATAQPRAFGSAGDQATQALGIAQRLLGGGGTVHHGLLGVERVLFHLLDHPSLEEFVADVLGKLLDYDSAHHGELAHTVSTFLRCNGNHVRAAKELHLHRNTLLYRLERARQILGRDFEDADSRLALQVALKIRGVIRPESATGTAESRIAERKRRAG
jgi:sugar diacid utilization regulator